MLTNDSMNKSLSDAPDLSAEGIDQGSTNSGLAELYAVVPAAGALRAAALAASRFLERSIQPGGGSAAYWVPVRGWSRPYPETTGYLLPTLFTLASEFQRVEFHRAQEKCEQWLLEIQRPDGAWNGGLHPPKAPRPSVFNTAQILHGLTEIGPRGNEARLGAALRAAGWMIQALGDADLWQACDYRGNGTPSYYAHAVFPLADFAAMIGDDEMRERSRRAFRALLSRIRPNGSVAAWGFGSSDVGFTHTIGYTLFGIARAASALGEWEETAALLQPAVENLVRLTEQGAGKLPAKINSTWTRAASYECPTGAAQIAQFFCYTASRTRDDRLMSAAAKLLGRVAEIQRLNKLTPGRGGLPGSWPAWCGYMRGRWPNWAAKFFVDAVFDLNRLTAERLRTRCASAS